jgi:hypothetical protein
METEVHSPSKSGQSLALCPLNDSDSLQNHGNRESSMENDADNTDFDENTSTEVI